LPNRDSSLCGAFLSSTEEASAMAQKEHLPSVSDKEQRMYEHVKTNERRRGRSMERAKAIAAATVVKHHNKKGHAKSK
jgi:hypothetical protein